MSPSSTVSGSSASGCPAVSGMRAMKAGSAPVTSAYGFQASFIEPTISGVTASPKTSRSCAICAGVIREVIGDGARRS